MTTPDLSLDVLARLSVSIDGLTAAMKREQDWRARQMQVIRQVPFAGQIEISAGAGTATRNLDKEQAKTGYCWSIRRLTCGSTANGWSAGSVTAFRNSVLGEPIMPFPVPAVNTIGRAEGLLMPGDFLQWSATGITLTGSILPYWGVADCFESWYLPFYIG
jgi:hypothetical protein